MTRSGGTRRLPRVRSPVLRIHRQEIARPEHQSRRRLGTGEKHGGASVADFAVRERLAGFGVPVAQQEIEEIAMARLCGRRLASRDDFVDRRGPLFLRKAHAPAVQEGERAFALRKPVDEGRPSRSFDIVARHMAQCLALAALRHGEQGAQDRLQSRVLKGLREIGVSRGFDRTQQLQTRLAKMRQQQPMLAGVKVGASRRRWRRNRRLRRERALNRRAGARRG